jgi:hypothetical protein
MKLLFMHSFSSLNSSFLGPNIISRIMFLHTFSHSSILNVRDQVLYATTNYNFISIFALLDSRREDKNSELNDSEHSPNLTYL